MKAWRCWNSLAAGADRKMANNAISAIGMHRDAAADAALDRFTRRVTA